MDVGLSARKPFFPAESDVSRRRILSYKDGTRAKKCSNAIGLKHNSGSIAGCNPGCRINTVDGWRITIKHLSPQRTGALREPFWVIYQKQWALYHTTAWDGKHGWWISAELPFPKRTGALKGAVLCDVSKQWALYHSTARGGVWS